MVGMCRIYGRPYVLRLDVGAHKSAVPRRFYFCWFGPRRFYFCWFGPSESGWEVGGACLLVRENSKYLRLWEEGACIGGVLDRYFTAVHGLWYDTDE